MDGAPRRMVAKHVAIAAQVRDRRIIIWTPLSSLKGLVTPLQAVMDVEGNQAKLNVVVAQVFRNNPGQQQ